MTELRLDIDRKRAPSNKWLCERTSRVGLNVARIDRRRTANGWHVVVTVRERLSPAFTVAMQAVLGSDPKRELYNLFRVRQLRKVPKLWRHPDRWNVLFHRKL